MSLTGKHLITMLGELSACAAAPAAHHHREIVIEVDDVDEAGGEEVMRCTLDRADIEELRYALMQADWSDTQVGLTEIMRQRAAGVRVDDVVHVIDRTPPPEPVAIEEMVFA